MISVKKLVKSFGHAFNGFKAALGTEQNLRIHVLAAFFTVLLAVFFRVAAVEWMLITLCILLVFGMELINTALERLCDFISPERRDAIKFVKDCASAGVLVVALGALICGLIIFVPRLINLI